MWGLVDLPRQLVLRQQGLAESITAAPAEKEGEAKKKNLKNLAMTWALVFLTKPL